MKRKVLQLVDNLLPGGTEVQAVQLTRLLHESSRYQVQVACLDSDGLLRTEVEQLGLGEIPTYPLTSFYDRNAVVQLRRFARFLRAHQIDIVHAHDFYTNIFGMAGAWLGGVPARIASRRETTGWRTPRQKRIERGAYRLAHIVIANAEAVRECLIKEGVRAEKILTVYNGLSLERVAPRQGRDATLAMFNLPRSGDCRFVTIVANLLHPVKDHAMFLCAARRVRQAVPEARFIIAGAAGPLTDPMRALAAELGIAGDVCFLGRCERVAEILSISDVCVLSSKAEGFSNAILEYMGAARPVVATDVGGAREAVVEGETGYLVQSGDDEAMAARITELLREPERARTMGRHGRRVVEEKFSCKAQLEHIEQLYDRLLAQAAVPIPESAAAVRHERSAVAGERMNYLSSPAAAAKRPEGDLRRNDD